MSRLARIRVDIVTREGEQALQRLDREAEDLERSMVRLDRSVDNVEQGQRQLGLTAGQTAGQLRRVGRSARGAGRVLSSLGSSTAALSGTLTTLAPQLGDTTNLLGNAASAAEMFAGAGGAVLRVLGPIAAAALAAGAAYAYFNGQLKEAEERQKKAAEAAENASQRGAARADFRQELSDRRLIATGEATEEEVQLVRRSEQIADELFGEEIAAIETQLAESGQKFGTEFDRLNNRLIKLRGNAAELAGAELEVQQLEEAKAAALKEEQRARREIEKSVQKAAQEQERQAAAAAVLAEELAAAAGLADAAKARLLSTTGGVPVRADGTTVQSAILRQAELNSFETPMSRGQRIREDLASTPQAFTMERLRASANFFNRGVGGISQGAGFTGTGLDLAGNVLGGNLAGMAGMLGPAGAAAGAGISALQLLGEKGAQGIIDTLKEQTTLLTDGLRQLPELISLIGDESQELAEQIAQALVDVAPELARAFAAERNVASRGLRGVERLADTVGLSGVADTAGGLRSRISGLIRGRNHSGLTVSDNESLRILEAGEVVGARGDMVPQSARVHRGGLSQTTNRQTVVYNGPVLSDPLSSWHEGMDSRFGDNGWDRKPNYAGGVL